MKQQREMCPFCQHMGIEESEYLPVGGDEFGYPAMIGDVPSCGPCAKVAQCADITEELLAALKQTASA